MYAAGVTCSNCHEPHRLKLRAEGNALCAQCHLPQTFDVAEHHHHAQGSAGAQCVDCHMPAKTYMGVDPRPRSRSGCHGPTRQPIGVPEPCTSCHADQCRVGAQAVAEWFPHGGRPRPHSATALHAGRGQPDAEAALDALILDQGTGIARATAVELLARHGDAGLRARRKARSPTRTRWSALAVPPRLPATVGGHGARRCPAARDPVRAVRIETARALAGADPQAMTPAQRSRP